jgi:integral membrane protein (TIGR01906 family)
VVSSITLAYRRTDDWPCGVLREMRSVLVFVGAAVLAVCLPLLAFASNGLALAFDSGYYSRGQVEQRVEQTYGLSQALLVPANRAIVAYFSAPGGQLADYFAENGVPRDFFGERETVHMDDVRGLVRIIGNVRSISIAASFLVIALMVLMLRGRAVRAVGRGLVAGAILSFAIVLMVGLATLIDFSSLFVLFHLLSFSNSFWILDPRTDHLIQMFPYGFWYNSMVTLIVYSLLVVAAGGAMGLAMVRIGRRFS